jgi:hypothetical protein
MLWDERKFNEFLLGWKFNENKSDHRKVKETKEWAIDVDPFLSLVVRNVLFFFGCKFMVLKKWVVLHLCVLIHDDGWNNFLFVALDSLAMVKFIWKHWLWNSMKECMTKEKLKGHLVNELNIWFSIENIRPEFMFICLGRMPTCLRFCCCVGLLNVFSTH